MVHLHSKPVGLRIYYFCLRVPCPASSVCPVIFARRATPLHHKYTMQVRTCTFKGFAPNVCPVKKTGQRSRGPEVWNIWTLPKQSRWVNFWGNQTSRARKLPKWANLQGTQTSIAGKVPGHTTFLITQRYSNACAPRTIDAQGIEIDKEAALVHSSALSIVPATALWEYSPCDHTTSPWFWHALPLLSRALPCLSSILVRAKRELCCGTIGRTSFIVVSFSPMKALRTTRDTWFVFPNMHYQLAFPNMYNPAVSTHNLRCVSLCRQHHVKFVFRTRQMIVNRDCMWRQFANNTWKSCWRPGQWKERISVTLTLFSFFL